MRSADVATAPSERAKRFRSFLAALWKCRPVLSHYRSGRWGGGRGYPPLLRAKGQSSPLRGTAFLVSSGAPASCENRTPNPSGNYVGIVTLITLTQRDYLLWVKPQHLTLCTTWRCQEKFHPVRLFVMRFLQPPQFRATKASSISLFRNHPDCWRRTWSQFLFS